MCIVDGAVQCGVVQWIVVRLLMHGVLYSIFCFNIFTLVMPCRAHIHLNCVLYVFMCAVNRNMHTRRASNALRIILLRIENI